MQAQIYILYENDIRGLSVKGLKAKIEAYQVLYGQEPKVLIEGNWYGPIDGRESVGFSVHSRYSPLTVSKIGEKWMTVTNGQWSHKVLLNEELGGATKIIFRGE